MNLATPPQEIRVHDPAAPRSGLPDFRANVTYLSGYEDFSRHAEVGTPVDLITRIGSSPPVRAIAPSSSYNRAAVIFTAPENTGIYTVTAASMTNPTQSSTATIVVPVCIPLMMIPLATA